MHPSVPSSTLVTPRLIHTSMRTLLSALAVILATALGSVALADDCLESTLCPGSGACTISGTRYLGSVCVLDFSGRNVTINSAALLYVDDGAGSIDISSANFTLNGTLRARDGSVNVTASGTFTSAGSGLIDVHSVLGYNGTINVEAAGAITLDGSAWNANGPGSYVTISSPVSVSGSNTIRADGQFVGDNGGEITILSDGDVNLTGSISADALGSSSYGATGGTIYVQSTGRQVYLGGSVSAIGSGLESNGGVISIEGEQGATVSVLTATGTQGGVGGGITLISGYGAITARGTVSVNGVGGTGNTSAGYISMTGASVTINAAVTANGVQNGAGGGVYVYADGADPAVIGTITVSSLGSIRVNGGSNTVGNYSTAGEIILGSRGDVHISGPVSGTAGGNDSVGATLTINAAAALSLNSTGSITTDTTGSGKSGLINLCGTSVALSGTIDNRTISGDEDGGINTVDYRVGFTGTSSLSMQADDIANGGGNVLNCQCVLDGATCASPAACAASSVKQGSYTPAAAAPTPVKLSLCY